MDEQETCEFCGVNTNIRQHHLIPKSKGGKVTAATCGQCESYIHNTWSHNELRDIYHSVDIILANEGFQKFLKWRRKQSPITLFKTTRANRRDKNKYH
jgi:glutaredoxin-related protein